MKITEEIAKQLAETLVGVLLQGQHSHLVWEEVEANINEEIEKSQARIVFRDGEPFVEFWFGSECGFQSYAPLGFEPWGPLEDADDDPPSEAMARKFRLEAENIEKFIGILRDRKVQAEAAAILTESRLAGD